MRGIARRRYHVLLGAGASVGGQSSDGRPIPGAEALAEELREEFGLPLAGAHNLRRLFAAASRRSAKDGSSLTDYVTKRFTGTTPPAWLRKFVEIGWQQVWTLNVDDCLAKAYSLHDDVAQQRLTSVSWTDSHRTPRESDSELLSVHLHGKASRAHRQNELVFDISSYIQATTANHRWHRLFGDAYVGHPFLIIGAALDAEFDLQSVLEQGPISLEFPSLIVLKDIDDLQVEEYRRFGLIPVRATAEAFFESVVSQLPAYLAELTNEETVAVAEVPPEAQRFLHQWREMSVADHAREDRRHDVFRGHEPQWNDAVRSRLFSRDVQAGLLTLSDSRIVDPEKLLHILSGPSFCGKTAILFEVSREFVARGFRVFLFEADVAPDLDSAYWWVQRYPKSILVFDDAADFARDIAGLYARCSDGPVVPRVLAVERSQRLSHMENVLVLTPRVDHSVSGRLSNAEIRRLISLLEKNNRSGEITGWRPAEKMDYFVKHHERELFSSMASLERGREFTSRVVDEFDSVRNRNQKSILAVASVAARLGYGLPMEVVRASAGVPVPEIQENLAGELGDLLVLDDGYLRLRHRFMGEVLLAQRLSAREKFEVAVGVGKAVAPHVSLAAIRASTLYYRIARSLMGHDMIGEILEGDSSLILDWYEELQDAFEWNARFWEQRALAAADARDFEPAYSWAREAVSRHRDALTLNTIGVILMRRAVDESSSAYWPADTFALAEEALRNARSEREVNEYPYETFFTYTLRLVKRVHVIDESSKEFLSTTWSEWYVSILAKDEAIRARLHERAQGYNLEWERLIGDSQD